MGRSARVVITGAGRGLGLEFARQWVDAGDQVIALARDSGASAGLVDLAQRADPQLVMVECDVGDDPSVEAAAQTIGGHVDGLEIVVNNAGERGPTEDLDSLDPNVVLRVFNTNTLGSLRMSRALLPLLRSGHGKPPRIIHLSSLMGSIADNQSGGSYAYRISKAGLNMACRTLAYDLARYGVTTAAIHPGWVQTRMGGSAAPLTTEAAVSDMIDTIQQLSIDQSGQFLDRHGEPLPY
jgi:NAD(P)-dependent dehydrogenase (short-subunit alcohol dehydrogenase family)